MINRQPFFFPDTTSYVRAADLAVRLVTHDRVQTAWTNNDPAPSDLPKAAPAPAPPPTRQAHGSDGRDGNAVMSGRSPYFGALLYIGWVTSGFWLFVIAQAIVGWWLIGLALRCFGISCLRSRLVIAAVLGLLTPLSFYTGLLLADDLAALGLLSFFILATEPPDLKWSERIGLILILLLSVASHFTHIVMALAMTGMLILILLFRRLSWTAVRRPIAIGAGATLAGLLSVMATNAVVHHALGKPPAMAPLLSARFIVDGPGRDYIAHGCGGHHFTVCRIPSNATDSDVWLWSHKPGEGGFLSQDTATREALSREDKPFAIEVLKAYPLRQGGMIVANTFNQLLHFDNVILFESCIAYYGCSGIVLPPEVRARMQGSLAGRSAWPAHFLNIVHYLAVFVACIALVLATGRLLREQPEMGRRLLLWIALLAAAMLANAFLGGAISAPQGRYQARIVWLIPLLALLAIERLGQRSLPADETTR